MRWRHRHTFSFSFNNQTHTHTQVETFKERKKKKGPTVIVFCIGGLKRDLGDEDPLRADLLAYYTLTVRKGKM